MKILMISCEEATRLISKALDKKLSFGDRFALRLRLMVCEVTRRAKHHLELVHQAISDAMQIEEKLLQDQCKCLSDDKKQRMREILAKEYNSKS